jgi:hypothetical protein
MAQVSGEIDRGHAAFAHQALDLVSLAERGAKLLNYIRHEWPRGV